MGGKVAVEGAAVAAEEGALLIDKTIPPRAFPFRRGDPAVT